MNFILGQTICVKTHRQEQNIIDKFTEGGIVLIRNPYSAITAQIIYGHVIQERKDVDVDLNYFKSSSKLSVAQALQCQC